jgi:hypothetical protein
MQDGGIAGGGEGILGASLMTPHEEKLGGFAALREIALALSEKMPGMSE